MILVVDDEATTAETIQSLLEAFGHQVDIALSCDAAIRRLHQQSYDLILSDINMPCRSGLELAQELHQVTLNSDTPLIFISGMTRPQDLRDGLLAGARDCLPKPIDPTRLLRAVDEHLVPQQG